MSEYVKQGYRPLAGMRCFSGYLVYVPSGFTVTVPLRGCGVSAVPSSGEPETSGYRPLAGMRCFL